MKKQITINTLSETKKLGIKIGKYAIENSIITLSGDLGAGKTTLTKSIAKGLNIEKTVNSPTFTICKIYKGRLSLYHFDAYRLEGSNEDLGFEEMIDGDGVAVIEWPQFMGDIIPNERLNINIVINDNDSRNIEFIAIGLKYEELLEKILC